MQYLLALALIIGFSSPAFADVHFDPEQYKKPKHGIAYKLTHLGLAHKTATVFGKVVYLPVYGLRISQLMFLDLIDRPVDDATWYYCNHSFVRF